MIKAYLKTKIVLDGEVILDHDHPVPMYLDICMGCTSTTRNGDCKVDVYVYYREEDEGCPTL